jgi:NADH-quinone oxidoreductase subunit J
MNGLAKLYSDLPEPARKALVCPTFWALAAGAIGLWLLLPARRPFGKRFGALLVALAGALFAYDLPLLGNWLDQGVYWVLALITLGAAVATISSQSPVYSAIWFATSLLGTAGLFFFSGAQFLAVATIVVYAGAIVVTFLFVIMLAQPEGHSAYDRLTWGGLPKVLAVITAGMFIGILIHLLGPLKHEAAAPLAPEAIAQARSNLRADGGVLNQKHMATLGRHLWSEHLISIELAGTLLLVALAGAVAIASFGRPRLGDRIEEALHYTPASRTKDGVIEGVTQ